MAYFLILLTSYQFIFRLVSLQETPLYVIFNPYVFLFPFILVWLAALGFFRSTADRNLLAAWLPILIFLAFLFPTYVGTPDFPLDYIRSIQFFWGPALLVPSLLGMFRILGLSGEPAAATARTYIKGLALLAAAITIFEIVAVDLFRISPSALPWINLDSDDATFSAFRPFGLPSYPQPNAVLLALLFWLSLLYGVRGILTKLVTLISLILSLSGTGLVCLILLLPLRTRRPFLLSGLGILVLCAITIIATYSSRTSPPGLSIVEKLNVNYILYLAQLFSRVGGRLLGRLTADEAMFGNASPNLATATGFTHDWAYFDVFYAFGFIGLAGYIFLYSIVLFLSCPHEIGLAKRSFFVIVAMVMNFHYGTLNYFIGQLLFSTLAALQLSRNLDQIKMGVEPR